MNQSDLKRNQYMLKGSLARHGYDWWWHSFTGYHKQTGEKKSFFVEYFIVNPAIGNDYPIFGQIPDRAAAMKPSYVMVKAGAWGKEAKQLHAFYPISALKMDEDTLKLVVAKCTLSETHMKGEVKVSEQAVKEHPEYMCDAGSMSWNLQIRKKIAFNVGYGANSFFRKLNAFTMFWHVEGMKTEYEGTVVYEGEEYIVAPEVSYGYADKNWGRDFTSPWVWISSCKIKNEEGSFLKNSVFDIGGGKPKVFGIPINRKLLIDFYYEGKEYEFNFSKFWMGVKTTFECYETDTELVWEIHTQNRKAALDLKCTCPKEEMLLVNYEAPDGVKRHNRLWNGGTGRGTAILYRLEKGEKTLIDKMTFENAGCEYGVYDK